MKNVVKSVDLVQDWSIGSDVEFFLRNKETNEIVSAEGIIQGTKYDPFRFDPQNHHYATSLDNVLAEGNIPPTTNAVDFYLAIEKLRKYIDNNVAAYNLETVAQPSARLDAKYLQTENAKRFGCEPSINTWTFEQEHPQAKEGDNARSTGFHLHCGYAKPSAETNLALGKACDLFLGIPSVVIEPENERKTVGYGTAGNIRFKSYGLEYRTLSSYFASSKELIDWSFRNFVKAIEFVNNNKIETINDRGQEIMNIINSENKKEAKKLIKEFNLEVL